MFLGRVWASSQILISKGPLTVQLLAGVATVITQEAWAKLHTPPASIGTTAVEYLNQNPHSVICDMQPALSHSHQTHSTDLSKRYHVGCKHNQLEWSSLPVRVFHACSRYGKLQYTWKIFMKCLKRWFNVSSQSKQACKCTCTMQTCQCGAAPPLRVKLF